MFYLPRHRENVPGTFDLRAVPAACVGSTGRELMMGGVTFGAALDALEQATGRETLWGTCQFIAPAFAGRDFVIETEELVQGRNLSQAAARVRDEETTVIEVRAALGARPEAASMPFARMPDVAKPEDCEPKPVGDDASPGNLFSQFERRLAQESDAEGRECLWFRAVDDPPLSTALLAIYADHMPGAVRLTRGSTSLDCTLRFASLLPSQWVLTETKMEAVGPRLFHSSMNLFAEDGTLLATASETGILPRASRNELREMTP